MRIKNESLLFRAQKLWHLKFIFQHFGLRRRMRFFMQALNIQVDCPTRFSLIWSPNRIEFDTICCLVFESTISVKCFFDSMMWYF